MVDANNVRPAPAGRSADPFGVSTGQLLVMHTDGIINGMDFSSHSAAHQEGLSALAAAIINGWGRGTDDSAVVVYRYAGPQC